MVRRKTIRMLGRLGEKARQEDLAWQKKVAKEIELAKQAVRAKQEKLGKQGAVPYFGIGRRPKPSFNVDKGDIIIGKDRRHIANKGHKQYHICEVLFKQKLGRNTEEEYIRDTFSHIDKFVEGKGDRWVKDAIYKINQKVKAEFGIEGFIEFKNANARIRKELFK